MKYAAVDTGHLVCDHGADSTEFYVVMSGRFAVKVVAPGQTDTMVRCSLATRPDAHALLAPSTTITIREEHPHRLLLLRAYSM